MFNNNKLLGYVAENPQYLRTFGYEFIRTSCAVVNRHSAEKIDPNGRNLDQNNKLLYKIWTVRY